MRRMVGMCMVLSSALLAWGQPAAVTQFVAQALHGYATCTGTGVLDLLNQAEAMPQTQACLVHARTTLAPLYPTALAAVQAQPGSVTRLKDFYAAWLSALEGLRRGPGEQASAYHGRVAAGQRRLSELGARLELEAQ